MHGRGVEEMRVFHLLEVFGLAEQRQIFRDKLNGRIVPVVAMRMRDQHGLQIVQHFVHGTGQRDQRIVSRLRRILDGRHGSRITQHGIYEQAHTGVFEEQGCVANELKLHYLNLCA